MKNFKYLLALCILVVFTNSCKEDITGPQGKSQGPPQPVSNTTVKNLPGGAEITYTLPDNRDLLYVKAVYSVNGIEKDVKSSLFKNFLTINGFGNTNEYSVKLYAVNRHEELSSPVTVTIKPLEPPVLTIARSITYQPDFGGLSLNYENLTESEVSIHILTKNAAGEWVPAEEVGGTASVLYTKRIRGTFAQRGFPAESKPFAIFVKDRWDNRSDTAKFELVPLFESELDRNCPDCFKAYPLTSDGAIVSGWGVNMLFNNSFADPTYHTQVGSGVPQWFTIDMGKVSTISRFKMWQRRGNEYNHGNVKKIELYGSNNPQDAWSSWTLLGTFEGIRPSGLPVGATSTAEDIAWTTAGEEFVLPPGTPPVRYLRFKTTETWGRTTFVHISELRFWGKQ